MVSDASRSRGFTLIEVLVAMAIIALSFSAILSATLSATTRLTDLIRMTDALMVTNNIINETRIGLQGDYRRRLTWAGVSHFNHVDWQWRARIRPIAPGVSALTVAVHRVNDPHRNYEKRVYVSDASA